MTGARRILLLALAAYHRWRAERDLFAGERHARRAAELEAEADRLKSGGGR